MRKFTFILAALLLFALTTTPSEARHRKHHKSRCGSCAKAKCQSCGSQTDSGYRAAAWGGSVYHTSESCKAVSEIAKEKLVTGWAATYGRRRHCCCGHA